ncbi:DNA polymerase III, beta subunit [Spongiibacter sp. IMCC21906]|jgi:DNA polymerase-3 subunit beta|uniref:DNA polymerase III subunit beta n=1 Tax=Spongiibacter sp. IMCC21906 TaxID=1620392 RepID=UPI00062DCCF9|nr:DNA polymerase III subunit beta [Spongiibacter sp. IMCC21906]AKH68124.1 DNA polymerase III, beta subunit [Spongiibacter sp. IMCC21906]
MKFSIPRDALIKPLNLVAGVVERRQTLPVLANVQIVTDGNELSLTGTDLEVELIGRVSLEPSSGAVPGEITVPAKKLVDICKALPEGAQVDIQLDEQKLIIKSGRSRFQLSTLSASDFPSVEQGKGGQRFTVKQGDLKRLIEKTNFAMAQQDVRYYLNGMLFEVESGHLRVVATDGHRLAMATLPCDINVDQPSQVILPRKGVIELSRLLMNEDQDAEVIVSNNHIRVVTQDFTFTSKLIDGKFPDYERVLPRGSTKLVLGSRSELKQAFARTAILSNEKYRGIRIVLSSGNLQIIANNPEQEEAEETVAVDYQGESLEIGFNVSYLLDVLSAVSGDTVKFSLSDANSSALIEESESEDCQYVVMPMRL